MAEASRTRAFTDLIAGRIVQRERGAATVVGTAVLNEANAPPPTLAELKETVHKLGATTVEYHLLPDRLITWVISPTGRIEVRSIQLDRAELDRSASELLRLIETPIPGPPAPDTAVDALIAARDVQVRQLYKWLIAPIEALLPPSPTDTVAIIPHRDLFRVPFAALKDGTGRYLIERNPLVYELSITVAGYGSRKQRGRAAIETKHARAGQPQAACWTQRAASILRSLRLDRGEHRRIGQSIRLKLHLNQKRSRGNLGCAATGSDNTQRHLFCELTAKRATVSMRRS